MINDARRRDVFVNLTRNLSEYMNLHFRTVMCSLEVNRCAWGIVSMSYRSNICYSVTL